MLAELSRRWSRRTVRRTGTTATTLQVSIFARLRISSALLALLFTCPILACGSPDPFGAWLETYLSAIELGVSDNVAHAVRSSSEEQRRGILSGSCAAMFTLEPELQEIRALAWREARSFASSPSDADIAIVASYATMTSSDACFNDHSIRTSAFGESPFTQEPLRIP